MTGAPYHYGVHRGTMTGADALAAHYDRCRQLLEDACAATGLTYWTASGPWWPRRSQPRT